MRCRKNVKSMISQEKADFARAIVLLKAEPSVLHFGTQNRYDDYVEIHREALGAADIDFQLGIVNDPGWAHFDSAFFPWHRELLYQFEEELRLLVPGVTVPYWDWTRDQQPGDAGWPFTHDFIGVEGTQSVNFQDGPNNQVLREPAAGTDEHLLDREALLDHRRIVGAELQLESFPFGDRGQD